LTQSIEWIWKLQKNLLMIKDYIIENIWSIISVIPLFSLFFRKVREKILDIYACIFSVRLYTRRYYDTFFMTKRIKSAKRFVRVVCVRNERISHSDVVEAIREFIENNKDCLMEIFAISPELDDCVLIQIMKTLPNPPEDVTTMREQIKTYKECLKAMVNRLSQNDKRKIFYYEYKALPLIHLCQFDHIVYLGFQMFQRNEVENESLLKYAIKIRINTRIGKLYLKQLEDLKNNNTLTTQIDLTC